MHRLPNLSWLNWVRLALIPAGGDWRDLDAAVNGLPGNVDDPRVSNAYPHSYGVLGWQQPSHTVSGTTSVGCGAYAVADVRLGCEPRAGAYGVMGWEDAAGTITGSANLDNGRFSVADPRRPPPSPVVIVAKDGTWHRPLTTLELALLQGLPPTLDGRPLVLSGGTTVQRKHIGNAVPVGAARAIAGQMLRTLAASDQGGMFLSASRIWVAPSRAVTMGVGL
jgi:site-specific DNA-cytosine methylase